jgi:uncharacterized protein (DUF885 family)
MKPKGKATFIALIILSMVVEGINAQIKSNDALQQLFENYYEERLKLFPLTATAVGDSRYNNILQIEGSEEFIKQVNEFYTKYLSDLNTFKPENLNFEDRISLSILKYILARELKARQFRPELMPITQFSSLPLTMGQLGSGLGDQPFKSVQDYDNWLQRVNSFTVWTDTTIANLRKGIKAGMILPGALVVKMIPQYENLAKSDTSKNVFYGPVKHFPGHFSKEDKICLINEFNHAINEQLIPSYKKLGAFLSGEYLEAARSTSGINALPDGDAMYEFFVSVYTTTDRTPEEIYQTGLNEVQRITGEMELLKNQLDFNGSLKELFSFMQTDKRFMPYTTEKEVLDSNWKVLITIQPQINKLFGAVPKTPFEIRATESFRAAAAAPQYNRSSADGTRPGIFYVPILDPTKVNVTNWALEATFLHEAIPGHHFQISIQQENIALPKFRRFSFIPAFGEGWALYCESLGEELGCYTDPYQKMGYYGNEIHRAIRLVVDVGLHTGKMTREEAIKYVIENEAISENIAIQEIERYMAIPGQALAYKTGELKIKEFRDKYQKLLGSKFNLRDFHDILLSGGSMPLNVLETYLDEWANNLNVSQN